MIKKFLISVSSVLGLATALVANAGMMDGRDYGMMGGDGMGYGGGMLVGWVTLVLVWTTLILGIIAILRWLKKNP